MRAAGLALRSRVPGLRRADVDGSGLIRTWTARGTVHLIDPADWPWLHAALGARNRARFDAAMRQRGDYDAAAGMLGDLVAVLRDRPLDRAGLLRDLAARGHPGLGQRSVNVLMPWAAAQGLVAGLPDGRYRAAEPPPAVDAELALATLARRYLAGYGPAAAADLASWSGLPLGAAREVFGVPIHAHDPTPGVENEDRGPHAIQNFGIPIGFSVRRHVILGLPAVADDCLFLGYRGWAPEVN